MRAAFADAKRALEERATREDPDPNVPREGIKPGQWDGAPWNAMPPNCPFQVLGHNGPVTFVVSAAGQLHEVERWDMATMAALCAPFANYMHWAWPAFGPAGKDADGNPLPPLVKRVERDKMMTAIINEAARRGLFDPSDRVRGRGGWQDRAGRFVWHSGEYLWTVTGKRLEAAEPGELDGFLYTRLPDVQRPWAEPVELSESPALRLLDYLKTWSWERPSLDPLLFLGWFATGYMGGALKWRPTVFTTGGAGVGKSTLHYMIQTVFERSLHATADTTAAGIYQRVKQDSLPVTVDELENKPGSVKATAVIELARIAASGAKMYRGGADHEGTAFEARNSFLFSAINPPPLGAQDKSRMAILVLSKLDRARAAPSIDLKDTDGRMILRQVMDGWRSFQEELLPKWRLALHEAEVDTRAQDTYGTLLAAAELLVGPEMWDMLGTYEPSQAGFMIAEATSADRAEQIENWLACLERLMGSTIESWRSGDRLTIGGVLEEAIEDPIIDWKVVRQKLGHAGLGIRTPDNSPCDGPALAIPGRGPALERIYQDTEWSKGVWTNALKQGPRNVVLRGGERRHHVVKINGTAQWCLLVDLKAYGRLSDGS